VGEISCGQYGSTQDGRCHIHHTLTHHIANSPTENSPNIFSASGKFIHGYFNHGNSTNMQLCHPLSVTASYGIKKTSFIMLNLKIQYIIFSNPNM
jgi:hypothetical protein